MRQHIPTTRRHVLKPAEMREVLHELMPLTFAEQMPVEVIAWSRKRVWTRMRATYADGEVVTVHFDRNGKVSSVGMAIRGIVQRVTGKAGAPIADSDGDDGA